MLFCDVDGGVIIHFSWSRIHGFSRAKSAKVYANGFGDEYQTPLSLAHSVMLFTVLVINNYGLQFNKFNKY
jgi:hypothetical protein